MPKLGCLCGNPVNLSKIPNPNTFSILSEVMIEELVEKLIVAHNSSRDPAEFSKKAFSAFSRTTPGLIEGIECQNCGRVAIFSQPLEKPDFWLRPENEGHIEGRTLKSIFEASQRKP